MLWYMEFLPDLPPIRAHAIFPVGVGAANTQEPLASRRADASLRPESPLDSADHHSAPPR